MKSLTGTLFSIPLIKYGFCLNQWVWFHILGGGVLARILLIWFGPWETAALITVGAVFWEVIEFFIETGGNPARVYGSIQRWAWDSLGDILGTVACALLVSSMEWGGL